MKQGLSLRDRLLRTKPVEALVAETAGDSKHRHLARSFELFQLTMLGGGATVGTGIFIIRNEAVPVPGRAWCCPS
jgi:basic amino acid/polyamine antiporter, APA family